MDVNMFGSFSPHVSNINAIRWRVPTLEHPGRYSSSCLRLQQILSHVIPCWLHHLPYLEPLSRTASMLTSRTVSFHTGGTDQEAHPRQEPDQRSRFNRNSEEQRFTAPSEVKIDSEACTTSTGTSSRLLRSVSERRDHWLLAVVGPLNIPNPTLVHPCLCKLCITGGEKHARPSQANGKF